MKAVMKRMRCQKKKQQQNIQNMNNKMAELNLSLSVITLNLNGLSLVIKRQRLVEWIKKMIQLYYLQETHFRPKDANKLRLKDGKGYSMQIVTKRDLGYLYCYTKQTLVKNCYETKKALYIDKSINSSGRYNNFKHICTK